MSDWHHYLEEKAAVDQLVADGFAIVEVSEGLDGDGVRFARPAGGEAELLLTTAEGRKYLGTVLIRQLASA